MVTWEHCCHRKILPTNNGPNRLCTEKASFGSNGNSWHSFWPCMEGLISQHKFKAVNPIIFLIEVFHSIQQEYWSSNFGVRPLLMVRNWGLLALTPLGLFLLQAPCEGKGAGARWYFLQLGSIDKCTIPRVRQKDFKAIHIFAKFYNEHLLFYKKKKVTLFFKKGLIITPNCSLFSAVYF